MNGFSTTIKWTFNTFSRKTRETVEAMQLFILFYYSKWIDVYS